MQQILYRVQDIRDEDFQGRCFYTEEEAQEFIDTSYSKPFLYIEEIVCKNTNMGIA